MSARHQQQGGQWPASAGQAGPLPRERLDALHADMRDTKARLRDVLEGLARKYDIPARDVSFAIDGHADNMLADLVFGIERDLEQEADAAAWLAELS
jgi:hypothetical protein